MSTQKVQQHVPPGATHGWPSRAPGPQRTEVQLDSDKVDSDKVDSDKVDSDK